MLGVVDLSPYPLDKPLEAVPAGGKSDMQHMCVQAYELSRREGLTLLQVAKHFAGSRSHFEVVGTAIDVADQIEHWYRSESADGFNVLPPVLPEMLELFVDGVIPELQRRGVFRTAYEGPTLREKLELPIPENRFASGSPTAQTA
jgi:alkanesulfonate monooxygenase SsuD/methylene tetrahydromethanopterin reductase-like flavin-dependent oxidoreductase (luciferase family)